MNNKSIKKNALLNSMRVLLNIIFPLITFPYATKILGTNNIGRVQFSSSIITFILLISALGVSNYAVREGTKFRNDRRKLSDFASDIFSINLIFTFIAYVFLILLLIFYSKLKSYTILIGILSIQVLFTTLGVEWIYSIYEDYKYITIRSFFTQLISLILLFLFIHKPEDYYLYAFLIVISNSGANFFNYLHAKKYVDLKFKFNNDINIHLKPLLVLFSNNLAQQVYINSDVLMLGLMTSDYNVGIYSVSVKIYSIIKQLLNASIVVAIPRMAFYSSKKYDEQFYDLGSKILNISLFFILPIISLLFLLSDDIVLLLSTKDYFEATTSLKILSLGLICAVFANLFCNGILIVKKDEKYVLRATIFAALTNFTLNFIFIKLWKQNGTALTTVIAEFIVMVYSYHHAKKYIKTNNFIINFIKELLGCSIIFLMYFLLYNRIILINSNLLKIILFGIIGVVIYLLLELLLKNQIEYNIKNQIFLFFKRKEK